MIFSSRRTVSSSALGNGRDGSRTSDQFDPVDEERELRVDTRPTLDTTSEGERRNTDDGAIVANQRTAEVTVARSNATWQPSGHIGQSEGLKGLSIQNRHLLRPRRTSGTECSTHRCRKQFGNRSPNRSLTAPCATCRQWRQDSTWNKIYIH